jgi:hypothetical protein
MADEAKDANAPKTKQSYLVGGLWLNIDRAPDELLKWYRDEKAKGMRPSPMLLMIWQRTAIHFSHHKNEIEALSAEVKELGETVRKLEAALARRGST